MVSVIVALLIGRDVVTDGVVVMELIPSVVCGIVYDPVAIVRIGRIRVKVFL
jgi:hypothetical protein